MDEYKGAPEESEQEQTDEYSFLQEVIKDEAFSRKKLKIKIFRVIGLGVIFGIAACISFCAVKPWIEKKISGGPSEVSIPKDEEPQEEETDQGTEGESETSIYSRVIRSLDAVATSAKKSMVEICTSTETGKAQAKEADRLSGVVIADNGQELLILGQLIDAASGGALEAIFYDGTIVSAAEKQRDENLGLGVYAVNRSELEESLLDQVKVMELGSSYTVSVGDAVILLGKPMGVEDAVTYGFVASCEDTVERADGQYGIMSINASGYQGGSGVIVDTEGRIIGVIDQEVEERDNSALIYGYTISDIKDVAEFLSNGNAVPYLGIRGTDVTEEMEESRGIPKGVYVKEVEADSPAMAAGIQSGDVLTAVGDSAITGYDNYHNILMEQSDDSEIVLKGYRQGTGGEYVEIDFPVVVGSKK